MAAGDISGPGVHVGAVSGVHMPGVGIGVWVGGVSGLPLPEAYFSAPVAVYDTTRGVTHNGTATAWDEQVVGGASNQAVPGTAPAWNLSDAFFGNSPSIQSTGTQWLVAAGTAATAQPLTLVYVGVPPSTAGTAYVIDSGNPTHRCILLVSGGVWGLNAGSGASSSIARDASQACCVIAVFNGASTTIRVRKADGTIDTEGSLSPGANGRQGMACLASRTGSVPGTGRLRYTAMLSGAISAGEITAFETNFLVGRLGFTAV